MAAYFLTPIYTSSEKRQLISERIKGPLVAAFRSPRPDEGTRQECRNVEFMNRNFSVTFIKSLNQSNIKPCLMWRGFSSEDATNVSANGEDATDCWSGKVLQVNLSAISKALWIGRWARASGKYLPVHDLAGICHYGQCDWLRHLSGRVVPSRRQYNSAGISGHKGKINPRFFLWKQLAFFTR